MSFDELRKTIAAEMPAGWGWELLRRYNSDVPPDEWVLDLWNHELKLYPDGRDFTNPEALLAAWREMKGKLKWG